CYWKIEVAQKAMTLDYEGRELRIIFGESSGRYKARLAVEDNTNGMKYFYEFFINCQTEFTKGTVVLSNSGGHAVLTFVKPDGTVQPGLYEAINQEALPGGAMQLVPLQNQFYLNRLTSFWITYTNGGVLLDAD